MRIPAAVRELLSRPWKRPPPAGAVLVYHRVARLASDPFGQAVTPETFERQLHILRQFGTLVNAEALVARLGRGEPVERMIAVTFDDGYVDNLTTAAPIAARLGVSLTVFVAVEPVVSGTPFWWDVLSACVLQTESRSDTLVVDGRVFSLGSGTERADALQELHAMLRGATAARRATLMRELEAHLGRPVLDDASRPMTIEELRALASQARVTIGAHTMTHPSLAALADEEQLAEMSESRLALERLLDLPVRLLAYPFGKPDNVSDRTRALAAEAGYEAAFTTIPRPMHAGVDRFAIPRLTIHEWPDDVFTAKVAALVGPPLR